MTDRQRILLTALRDYAQNSLDGKCNEEEGGTLLSALINAVDTVKENGLPELFDRNLTPCQGFREQALVEFICNHDPNRLYPI